MPVVLVANVLTAGASGGGTSSAIDTTGATLLVFAIAQQGTNVTVSDSKSNTWTGLTVQAGTSTKSRLFYAASPTVGTGHTFTVAGASTFSIGAVQAFSGVVLTTPNESQNGAFNNSAATIQPGSVTPVANGALIVTGVAGGSGFNATGATIGSSFTITGRANFVPSTSYGIGMAYLVQGTSGAVNPLWTNATTTGLAATIAVFTASAIAAGPRQSLIT